MTCTECKLVKFCFQVSLIEIGTMETQEKIVAVRIFLWCCPGTRREGEFGVR